MSQIVPMDADGNNIDFDNKENNLHHSNISRTPCREKGYEELDMSELNMKLRYSITPASSPLSKSLTSHCLDNRDFNNDDSVNSIVICENNNLTRSLNSTITRNDTKRSIKSLPLQALSNGQSSENTAITLSGIMDNDEHISLSSTPLPVIQTPEATTPSKEVPKQDGGSPILRGLKSVLNMFRSSQSPIPEPEDKNILNHELHSPIDANEMLALEIPSISASTPIVTKHKINCESKRSSPLKESITFNDDLEKELQWKDDTTILFKEEKIPIHKLFPAHFLPSISKLSDCVTLASTTEQNANMNQSLEYMDISNNDNVLLNKVAKNITSELQESLTIESDGEFVDCETTVNVDIADNREDTSCKINVTKQCNLPEQDIIPNSHQLLVNNSQKTTDLTSLLEDNFIMKNSYLSQLIPQPTDVSNEFVEIVANKCNVTGNCDQSNINGFTVDKQQGLELNKSVSNLSQNVNKLLGYADIDYERSDNEKQNVCDNKQYSELIFEALDLDNPIINTSMPKDGFEIIDNVNKDSDKMIIPSEVPLPDEEFENESNSEKLVVSMVITENTSDSINEEQSILKIDDSKLVPTESCSKFSNNEKETSLCNVIYVTTNQSESLIENASNNTERLISDQSNVILDELIGPKEIMTKVTNTIGDKNLRILSKDLNEISEEVNDRKRTFDMSLNLNSEQESTSFISKPGNLVNASEHIPNIISEKPHNFQQNNSYLLAPDKHVQLISDDNLDQRKTESVCKESHLISSKTIADVKNQSVSINNEENYILLNYIPNGKKLQSEDLNKCEELINVSGHEQTDEIKDKIKYSEVTYTENQVSDALQVDNNMNKEVIKGDLDIVNEFTIENMNISPSLLFQNISTENDFHKIDDLCFTNSKINNVDLPENKIHAAHSILNNCIEENNLIVNNKTEQEADNIKVLNFTTVNEEVPASPLVNNNMDQEEPNIENVNQLLSMSSKIISPLPSPKIISKAYNDLDIDGFFTATQKVNSTEKVEFVAHVNTERHNCNEQINLNVVETELITNNTKSLKTIHAVEDIFNIAVTGNKINTEKKEDYLDHVNTKESIESPPLSPVISCKGYNFDLENLEDPFATKTRIQMSPPPGYKTTSLSMKEKNSIKLDRLNGHKGFQGQIFYPGINSDLSSSNERVSKTKNHESTLSRGEASSNVNDNVVTPVDVHFGKVVDNDPAIKNVEESSCQTEVDLNKEKGVIEELSVSPRESLLNEDEMVSLSSQNMHGIANFQTKNVFNLPEMSGVFISKSSACLSQPLLLENIQAEVDINFFDNRSEDNYDKNVEANNMSFIGSSLSNKLQDAAADEVNTEDEDTVEGPFFESEEFSNVDKITDQNDMINFTDTSSREVTDNVNNEEMFIDAEAFDFLLNQNKSNVVIDSGKESLFLKFDPLFAKRISSDGVLSALNEIKRRESTPKKILKASTFEVTCDKKNSGPSKLNNPTEIHNTLESSFEDPNVTLSKPMMVVNPAINASSTQRNKSCTPPRVNRGSLTFTSPAIAVIDRLLSLSANSSPLNCESTNTCVRREPNEAEVALTQLRELLAEKEIHVQNLRIEGKDLKNRLNSLESQVKKLESESEQKLRNINELNESLAEKTKVNKSMTVVLEEYERTMASLIAEIEQDKKQHAEERTRLKNERNEQTAHLASMELAFNDLHSKYEKSKQIIMSCKANEEAYRRSNEEFQESLLKMQKNYELLKQHATSQLNHANREFDRLKRAHEAEILKLNAMVKRKEVDICSLEETLAQKIKTNEELAAICDDLINKVG